jgi:hypothetical protein
MRNKTEFEELVRKFGPGGALEGADSGGIRALPMLVDGHRIRKRPIVEFGLPQTTMKCKGQTFTNRGIAQNEQNYISVGIEKPGSGTAG